MSVGSTEPTVEAEYSTFSSLWRQLYPANQTDRLEGATAIMFDPVRSTGRGQGQVVGGTGSGVGLGLDRLIYRPSASLAPLCRSPIGSFGLPGVVEQLDHLLVQDEDDGYIQTHPSQPGDRPLVERLWSLVLQDLESTVHRARVAMSF